MRRALLLLSLFALFSPGCKKDELQAALDAANAQLAATQQELAAQQQSNEQLTAENQSLKDKIAALESELAQLNTQLADLARKAGTTEAELAELRREKAKREAELKVYKGLFDSLKKMVDAGTIKVAFRKGRLVVKLDNSILFDSGKKTLKKEGQAALRDLAKALNTVADRDWLVAGHTDNVPIKTARFADNWQLSSARAIEVVTFLIDAGMDPKHIGAAGFAEYDPVADNKSDEGKAANRRIEIVLMPSLGDIPGMKEMLTGG